MKKTAVPAKRSARARIVELNGPAERVELLLLIFTAPLWGILFPLMGISTINTIPGICALLGSACCFIHFLHMMNSKFSFEDAGVRLPGVDHRILPYANMQRIYLDHQSPLLLTMEFEPYTKPAANHKDSGKLIKQVFEVQHLTEESARQLWSLFAMHFKNCTISQEIREKLVNWRTLANKEEPAPPVLAPLTGSSTLSDSAITESALARSSQIARDLSMLVDLKPFDPVKVVGQYLTSYSDTFRKTWLTCWITVAAVAYPTAISTMIMRAMQDQQGPALVTNFPRQETHESLSNLFSPNFEAIKNVSLDSLSALFGNYIGVIGLILLIYVALFKFIRHLHEPDSIFIDYMGITTQKRTTAGVQPKEHRGWKTIEEIKLVRPNDRSNSSRWSILFQCNQEKAPIEVPFKAFSSDRVRHQFIECLDTWGRNIKTDPKLLEALSPGNQTSYTELWLSGLSQAPKIDEMTPHSVGLRLESRAYEIVSQLASGGQGIAYLARKLPATEALEGNKTIIQMQTEDTGNTGAVQVVLKETVLPIFVDERARAKAVARFERDAKLLASLDHPLIVRLEDYFVENSRAYLALEYIPGKTLKERVEADGPLSEQEVRRLALLMVDIVEYLHGRTPPVVHRDFTPDNLMLTAEGKIKLIDFDVALEQSSFSQANATIVGKQAYIPLEQFRGKPCPQSDIYAIGATLAYLLTGFEPEALQASHPKTLRPEISPDLDQIIADATALELGDRIANAQALRQRFTTEKGAAPAIKLVVVADDTIADDSIAETAADDTLTTAEAS